ncbi:MAG: FkbM family methyltransferase [Terracidiphilus sp.]|jgi:FkbM family methyltransferase
MNATHPTVCGYRVRSTPPPLFRFAALLNRWKLRGGYRLGALASRGCVVEYDLGDGFHVTVPIYREDNRLGREEILRYGAQMTHAMSSKAASMRNATLIDCGADIGMMSILLRRRIPAIDRVVAFEPNVEVLPFLSRNLSMLPCATLMLGHAVGNINGAGRLVRPARDHSDHARFLVADPMGNIRVITVDSLGVTGDIILKIDVEGGEYAVLEGALETIRQAPRCVISLEAHPAVAARTGRNPSEALRMLDSIRPFRFVVAGAASCWELSSLDQPLFPPGAQVQVLDIVASAGV